MCDVSYSPKTSPLVRISVEGFLVSGSGRFQDTIDEVVSGGLSKGLRERTKMKTYEKIRPVR